MKLPAYDRVDLDLPRMGSWPASRHRFDAAQVAALRAAEAAGRPLLVRGDPGTGKSQLAHAAAVASGRPLVSVVVDGRSEANDLKWSYDAIARLADAHIAADPNAKRPDLDPARYLQPGPLWWAFNWPDAEKQAGGAKFKAACPERPGANWQPEDGTVLLIDEIDKAEADLPNGLLEALGNGSFVVGPTGHRVLRPDTVPAPMVIVTTNEERELPAPFLRRCLVLTLQLPKEPAKLKQFLVERGELHFPTLHSGYPELLGSAAVMLLEDRERARENGVYLPGLAEFLDLLRVLERIGGDADEELERLRDFVFDKQPVA